MTDKEDALRTLSSVLDAAGTSWALIGGVALQLRLDEPRTTLDIDIALFTRGDIPRDALVAAGFRRRGSHPHSDDWMAVDGTPVQFADDPAFASAIHAAEAVSTTAGSLRVAAGCHAVMLVMLVLLGIRCEFLGWIYGVGIVAVAILLAWEHWLVRPDDLSRVNQAFFQVNAVISVGLFLLVLVQLAVGV